jgi:type IV pilus assembly protein PilA
MSTKVKGNNKGFSLVELIVVMAIMAILAVTLAPRLTHYIDKARQASDREVVNAVYTAVKYTLLDEDIYNNVVKGTDTASTASAGLTGTNDQLFDYDSAFDLLSTLYTGSDGKYTKLAVTGATDKFYDEITSVVGDSFDLKSTLVGANTELTVTITDKDNFSVELDYDTDDSTAGYKLSSN